MVRTSTSSRSETALLPLMQMGVYEVKLIAQRTYSTLERLSVWAWLHQQKGKYHI